MKTIMSFIAHQCYLSKLFLLIPHILLYPYFSLFSVNMRITKKAILREYLLEIEILKAQLQQTRDKTGYIEYAI